MITEIGIVGGEIWGFVEKRSQVTLSEIIKEIDRPKELIFMSLGWLAREGHILLKKEDADYKVSLR
ncbi:MAG: winged helix-turn-helix domain-containing protein [Candidatus Omnitrophota bacterium]